VNELQCQLTAQDNVPKSYADTLKGKDSSAEHLLIAMQQQVGARVLISVRATASRLGSTANFNELPPPLQVESAQGMAEQLAAQLEAKQEHIAQLEARIDELLSGPSNTAPLRQQLQLQQAQQQSALSHHSEALHCAEASEQTLRCQVQTLQEQLEVAATQAAAQQQLETQHQQQLEQLRSELDQRVQTDVAVNNRDEAIQEVSPLDVGQQQQHAPSSPA